MTWQPWAGALVVAATVALLARRVEVRLVLLGAGLLMATLAGTPLIVLDTFGRAMVAGMVAPICASMGFAAVLAVTGCDRHLVAALTLPLRRARLLLLPGGILAAYVVNLAVPSQASTAAALGPILVPLLLGAGVPPAAAGAALVLGASFGGDLLNPGAQDVQAIAGTTGLAARPMTAQLVPASLAGIASAALVFTLLNGRGLKAPDPVGAVERVHLGKAGIPLAPIALLLAAYAGVPGLGWLLETPEGEAWKGVAAGLPVVRAMLLGVGLAALSTGRDLPGLSRRMFEGMGNAYASIISLTITAQCFGAGLAAVGLADAVLSLVGQSPLLAHALAVLFPWGLALLSGSGSGPILTYAQTFLTRMEPAHQPVELAAAACLSGAFGRTMSPVSAVVIYSSALVEAHPLE
ncbi:MAG: C4-dicarboxylate transporter DcuC, partial [Candidatus Eremiobacterota bacterium]